MAGRAVTLMQSIAASWSLARRSAALGCWPEGAIHSGTDVIVERSSLVHAAAVHPTPLVRIGVAGGWDHSRGTPHRFVTVLLTRVEHVDGTRDDGRVVIWVDAQLDRCRPNLAAARLLGRESTGRRRRVSVRPAADAEVGWARLPADIVAGDLLAVPCDGAIPLSDARRPDYFRGRTGEERPGVVDDDPGPDLPFCLK